MPRGDGTGPWGAGPMTGRGVGHCAGYEQPGFANPGPGFAGVGRGPGGGRGGRGFRNRFYATGLTGWQRAERGMQAWGVAPVATGDYAGRTQRTRCARRSASSRGAP